MKDIINNRLDKIKYFLTLVISTFLIVNLLFIISVYLTLPMSYEKLFKALALCELLLIAFISYNISKLIRKESKLKGIAGLESKESSAANLVFNKLPEGIIIIDKKGRIEAINQSLCKLLAVEESQFLYKNLYSVLSEYEDSTEEKALLAMIIETLETHKEYKQQGRLYVRDKESLYLELSTYILRNRSQNIAGVLAVVKDLTQKRNIDQQLLQVEKLVTAGQMAAELTHEIKNPICSIKGLLQVMGKRHKLEGSKYYTTIISEIERIEVLLQGFLTITHTGAVFEMTNINEIIESILPLIESQAVCKNITINLDMQKGLPPIYCDRESIRRVLVNIIQNAVDALNNNGEINISIWYDEINEKVKLEFKDNGTGIKTEYLDKIFEPFFTTKDNGSGLGLAISHRIIENHKGKLNAFNNLNGGATFVIELPPAE